MRIAVLTLVLAAGAAGGLDAQARLASSDSLVIEVLDQRTVLHDLSGFERVVATATFHGEATRYSGVEVRRLLEQAGQKTTGLRGRDLARYVVIEARDGYRVVFGMGDFDSSLRDRRILLADSSGGQPLDAQEGPWRLVIVGDDRGARSVRMVSTIRVREAD